MNIRTHTTELGQTMVEYGLLLALVAAVAVLTLALLGPDLQTMFTKVASDF
jgi:Flp pilus assembly pilin Flp